MADGKPVRAAVIGCGRMGALTTDRTRASVPANWLPLSHAEAIASLEGIELVALCDTSRPQLEAAAGRYPGVATYTDRLAMLEAERPDVVGVATRTEGRCAAIADCARGGVRGIHAEKPMARSLGECRTAIKAMREAGTGFTFGAVRRYMPPYRRALEVIASGEIGALRQIVIEHGWDMLMWGHPHTVDLAHLFVPGADVVRVQARLAIDAAKWTGRTLDFDPRLAMGYLEFDNGVSAIITAGHGFNLRAYGETGSVSVVGDGTRVELRKKIDGRPYELDHTELDFDKSVSGTQQAILNLIRYVRTGAPTGMSLDDIEKNQRVLFALVLSAERDGAAVNPASVGDDLVVTGRFGDLFA